MTLVLSKNKNLIIISNNNNIINIMPTYIFSHIVILRVMFERTYLKI